MSAFGGVFPERGGEIADEAHPALDIDLGHHPQASVVQLEQVVPADEFFGRDAKRVITGLAHD